MDDYVEIVMGKHFVGKIHLDTDAGSPFDEFDLFGKLYVPNNRYLPSTCDEDYFNASIVKLPVYMYSHSGVTINTTGFSCPWDSGQIGWICVSREDALSAYNRKRLSASLRDKIEDCLESTIKIIDLWLTGEVYGYTIHEKYNEDDEPPYSEDCIDSCWGFYGLDHCIDEVKENLAYYDKNKEIK